MERKERQSNIELLRIAAMLMIVANHYAGHGIMYKWDPGKSYKIWIEGSTFNKLMTSLFSIGGEIGVGIFFIITGYFLWKSKQIHIKKFILEVIYYGFLTSIIELILIALRFPIREFDFSLFTFIRSLIIPITGGSWWFITAYFFLMLMIPQLNSFLEKIRGGAAIYNICNIVMAIMVRIWTIFFIHAIRESSFLLCNRCLY